MAQNVHVRKGSYYVLLDATPPRSVRSKKERESTKARSLMPCAHSSPRACPFLILLQCQAIFHSACAASSSKRLFLHTRLSFSLFVIVYVLNTLYPVQIKIQCSLLYHHTHLGFPYQDLQSPLAAYHEYIRLHPLLRLRQRLQSTQTQHTSPFRRATTNTITLRDLARSTAPPAGSKQPRPRRSSSNTATCATSHWPRRARWSWNAHLHAFSRTALLHSSSFCDFVVLLIAAAVAADGMQGVITGGAKDELVIFKRAARALALLVAQAVRHSGEIG